MLMEQMDSRVNEILTGLAQGKSRDQLAEEFGHKNYKTLDIYMRRKGYAWDSRRKCYYPGEGEESEEEDLVPLPSGRVGKIISLLRRDVELIDIVGQLKFESTRELAQYMKSKGYVWDKDSDTYVYDAQVGATIGEEKPKDDRQSSPPKEVGNITNTKRNGETIQRFLPILEFLEAHQEQLHSLFTSSTDSAKIPRFVLPGVHVTKSVHMIYGLDQLVREFSQEKNISQKEIFEVALIEFFKKYGYQKEIEVLIGS